MSQARTHTPLWAKDELAEQLRGLADEPLLELRAEELRALADDLEADTRLSAWAEIELVETFARPESLTAAPPHRGARPGGPGALLDRLRSALRDQPARDRVLEATLGVLVFIPLLVTWFGLREAVRAYGELSRENPKEATRPFLQLWQTGFGGHLSSIGRFENMALTTVLLITLLVLLSLVHARVRAHVERAEADRHQQREHLLGRLASVLTRTQVTLAPHRNASPQQFAGELSKAASRLEALAARAEGSHKVLGVTASTVERATTALENAARALTAEVPKIQTGADRIEAAVRAGQAAATRAGTDSAAAARGIADEVKAAGATVEGALKALATAQQTLAAKSESVAQATERAAQALVASAGRTDAAVDGMREATERWDAAAAHWEDAAARLDTGIRALTGTHTTVPGPRHPSDAARNHGAHGVPVQVPPSEWVSDATPRDGAAG
ncbi:hypothetical protein AQ490_21875 [Wenjunlia vitaminophila]|uniref:Uncharacterized protein n=1 Tax=Wenjunlia vitaminophila TaxID=76728 RepID=A0A0T6LS96_WENVI|nr:hypothetical protein [Wenjunlia vitaminophila]KRV48973.1 hypothetical protein AQ490_21875 [Wenjunlia vitaminophila]